MHAAFLSDRTMSVKLGTILSKPKPVTGGAVQGSVLGVLDHNVVLNNLDDDLLSVYVAKYVDDMTTAETIDKDANYYMDEAYERREIHAELTEKSIIDLKKTCGEKHLLINDKKTQLLAVSSNREATGAWIEIGGEEQRNTILGKDFKKTGWKRTEELVS